MCSLYSRNFHIFFFCCATVLIRAIRGSSEYVSPEALGKEVTGFLGFKCNFAADGVHSLEPDVVENRSILCSIHSYFIYDKVKIIIPKKTATSKFKLLPEKCFHKVYSDFDGRVETGIENMGLVDYKIEEDNTQEGYTEKYITISPFNSKDVEFFCLCDNTEKVISDVDGRSALVHVHVFKYPHKIISVNLTEESYSYLPDAFTKDSFKNKKLEIELKEGELVVFACKLIDKKCFKKSIDGKGFYKSTKVVYHNNFAIFKAPMYIKSDDVNSECTCKLDSSNIYSVVLKPKYEKKVIHGCNFSPGDFTYTFTNNIDMTVAGDNAHITCDVQLEDTSYNHLIGMSCPGNITPSCFFQVYKPESNALEPSKIVYLDAQLKTGNIEYYEDTYGDNKVKLIGIMGSIPETASFTCICKKEKKTAYMTVKIASAYYGFLARIFILLIVLILLYF
ncbi:6-cysteine protein (P48/45) [Plasmodium ovale wallikeri]|uniref:6-cysteine protein (P48/45) n=2 Tax=Plasmodium ovale TaxID=36330 RepID=A0A1A8Z8E0_PLAOA|nr:6-cysteine protein (P48/45) [Plasmodium ovale wallikeri]SBT40475.1 6-cysteine protein (P48/45) [Plasmodium ovale wallikeri]SBT77972.1 6-cysteine protein, putative [Plasmodium ovale]